MKEQLMRNWLLILYLVVSKAKSNALQCTGEHRRIH